MQNPARSGRGSAEPRVAVSGIEHGPYIGRRRYCEEVADSQRPVEHARWGPRDGREKRLSCSYNTGPGGHCETSPPKTIPATGSGRYRASGHVADREGADLSDAARAIGRRLPRRPNSRHRGAPDRPMAIRAARPAIRDRQPAGRQRHCRHRARRAFAAGRLYATLCHSEQLHQRDALRKAQLQFHPRHRAGRGQHQLAPRHGGQSNGSGQDGSRVHRLRQGQSGQAQHGLGGQR
jgi:hypothetical protein